MPLIKYLTVFLLAIVLAAPAMAQKKVKIKQADAWKSGRKGEERFDKLVGNVILEQGKTTIYCDSAYFFKKVNTLEAYGRVRILDGDSVTVTSRWLEYNGNNGKARLRNNVVLTKLNSSTLYTDHLDFDRVKNFAQYFNGGRLVDSVNVLTSKKGSYNVNNSMASFRQQVHLTNPDYSMDADSLQYNSRTKIVYFRSKTTVVDRDSSTFVYEKGEYDTRTRKSNLESGTAETDEYTLVGNTYELDDAKKLYHVKGQVKMFSKKDNLSIHGESSIMDKNTGVTKIFNHAYLTKVTDDNDTLFITADTLVSIDHKDQNLRKLLAYKHVKIFKKDMQGIADSVSYNLSDSTISFFQGPVLWNGDNQLSADTITMLIHHNAVQKIIMVMNAFVVSQDTLLNFNQMKGRRIVADFSNNKMNRILVDGNAETLYHVVDDEDLSYTGINKMLCSKILIRFKDGKANNLTAYSKPEAKLIPPHEIKKEDKELKGFHWDDKKRPWKKNAQPIPQ